jgi:hypothetical protein
MKPTEEYLELRDLLDKFIDDKGIVVPFPGTIPQMIEAIIESYNDIEDERNETETPKSNTAPFYWTRPAGYPPEQCAEEGWYQWTERGLVYLGTTSEIAKNAEADREKLQKMTSAWKHSAKAWKHAERTKSGIAETWLNAMLAYDPLTPKGYCPWCKGGLDHAPGCMRQLALQTIRK